MYRDWISVCDGIVEKNDDEARKELSNERAKACQGEARKQAVQQSYGESELETRNGRKRVYSVSRIMLERTKEREMCHIRREE